ncbi:MAG: hypothetical protein IIB87_08925 [Chloroflexi bacterium]|nr:hypothetical protein [Chloroflexota bacterium]
MSKQRVSENAAAIKQRAADEIEGRKQELIDLSLRIHATPEVAFQEHKSSAMLADFLEGQGFALERGMSLWHDMIDWLGGYPFEVATPGEIKAFAETRGLRQLAVKTCGGRHGCNEFVFENVASPLSGPAGGAASGVDGAATNQGYP